MPLTLAGVAAVAALLAGCGSDGGATAGATSSATASVTAAPYKVRDVRTPFTFKKTGISTTLVQEIIANGPDIFRTEGKSIPTRTAALYLRKQNNVDYQGVSSVRDPENSDKALREGRARVEADREKTGWEIDFESANNTD